MQGNQIATALIEIGTGIGRLPIVEENRAAFGLIAAVFIEGGKYVTSVECDNLALFTELTIQKSL